MQITVNDLKTFYSETIGMVVRRLVRAHIHDFWPDVKGMRILGFGYAGHFLKNFRSDCERVFMVMPPSIGVHHWPDDANNLVCLAEEHALPIETESLDRILVIHSLEFSDHLEETYRELWRVLKSSGRMIVIAPNRLGLWARADWTPFGHGTPYSASQVRRFLAHHNFVHERTKKILYVPPFRSDLFIRSARFFEVMGQYICSALCGLHMIEVSKQLYAPKDKGHAHRVRILDGLALPKPAVNRDLKTSKVESK